jgi:hypothetical protein
MIGSPMPYDFQMDTSSPIGPAALGLISLQAVTRKLCSCACYQVRANSLGAAREKPALPVLGEENVPQYYTDLLPSFRDVGTSEKQLLFVRKLHLCAFTFDFTDQVRPGAFPFF